MLKAGFSLILQKHALSCLFGGRDSFFVLRNGRRKQMIKDRFSFVFFKSHSPSPISNHHVQCQGLTQRLSKTVSKGT